MSLSRILAFLGVICLVLGVLCLAEVIGGPLVGYFIIGGLLVLASAFVGEGGPRLRG